MSGAHSAWILGTAPGAPRLSFVAPWGVHSGLIVAEPAPPPPAAVPFPLRLVGPVRGARVNCVGSRATVGSRVVSTLEEMPPSFVKGSKP
eukprot:300838-Rhodomonas_salina.1